MEIKTGDQIKAKDTLRNAIDGARIGQVEQLQPYTGPLIALLGAGTQIAKFYGGMEMTLPAVSRYGVAS
ncbi:hypothetical protein [Variovorax ginsengisoli]|uniref:Uncharacterized protein n=1 Tax=Variovorax ginsengisoli TaxID=363844 RepID=A0ABT8SDJ9_9BURK|nr:hypothetical protein [Variovorax ginsengisoli]MDN8617827.1 hypothetical protein [Variovorax ginsengisoli]MDO1536997.1 hypothetical protein [Variovorax ginsengisoli]